VPPTTEKSIFLAAIEIGSFSERQAYLDEACQQDAQLRAKVEALLRASEEPRQLLDAPASVGTIMVESSELEGPGTLIGPYKLLEQIGEGGMGLVFVAEQTQPLVRRVALKVIKPGMDSRQVIARFEAERQALALMDHPNIAHVFDGGATQAGRPYFVMELVRGLPMTQFCDANRLTLEERLRLFHAVCLAVQHAHQKGIIHRDIKPSNVMVTSHDGMPVVKIIDFGIAKATGLKLTDKTVYTQFTQFVGTPTYLSPEQAGLSGIDVDTRTDIYAMGVLLYELLTGSTPFTQERFQEATFDEMRRIIREEEPPRPSTRLSTVEKVASTISANRKSDPKRLRQACHGELDWIVMKALEKDRKRRYETASAFAADVQRFLDHEPVQAHPPSLTYRWGKFVRRHRVGALAAALAGLALVTGLVGLTWGLIAATLAEARALDETNKKEAALVAARKSQDEATDKLWWSLYERARAGRFSRQVGQRLDSLAALDQAARIRPDERLRDEAIAAMALPDVRPLPASNLPASNLPALNLPAPNQPVPNQPVPKLRLQQMNASGHVFVRTPNRQPPHTTALAYGAKGQFYARLNNQGTISLRRLADDQEVRRITWEPTQGRNLFLSPDEQFLLALRDTFGVWHVPGGQPAFQEKLGGCTAHAFSPDGKRLAVAQGQWIRCFDLPSFREGKRWRVRGPVCSLDFNPDSHKLAVGFLTTTFLSGNTCVYDASSGALVADLPVGPMESQIVAWHPDGERLAVAGSDPRIQIWHVASRRKLTTLIGHVHQVPHLAFHPEGELLASNSWDGRVLLWQPSTGKQLLGFTSLGGPQFSEDGRRLRLIWEDGSKAELLEVPSCPEYRTLVSSAGAGHGNNNAFGDISPDGRLLAVGADEGARVWDLASRRELAVLPPNTPYVFFEQPSKLHGEQGGPARLPWNLLTGGSGGLQRWPLLTEGTDGKHLRPGSPEKLSSRPRAWFTRTAQGRSLIAATEEGGQNDVLNLETGKVSRTLAEHPGGDVRALSADGQYAASSGWYSDRVRLWHISSCRILHEWTVGKRTYVFFTPDSRALVISRGEEFSFWEVKRPYRLIRRLPRESNQYPGWVSFTTDGKLMALEMSPGVMHLVETASGRTVARLTDPDGDRATWQAFTPDGTRLVVLAGYSSAVHIWDLRAIRRRLKQMNLDWDWPEAATAGQTSMVLNVK
jgi:serine/threonine protein kinase/WD40 repeat protein